MSDIGVWVQGGGIQPGYEAVLRFNAHEYPKNPSVPPARRPRGYVKADIVIPVNAKGTAFYR
jgi:hypothetical protein